MKKKTLAIILGVVLILVIIRLTLPYFVTRYVNKTLAEVEGYDGSISGVNIAIIRGAYSIHDLIIHKEGSKLKVPFVDIKSIDLSVEWNALFKGKVAGEIILLEPRINFVAGPTEEEKQDGSEADWTETIKELMPIQINRFEVKNGKIAFFDFSTKPEVNVFLESLNMVVLNLGNVEDKNQRLPSSLTLSGTSVGGGMLTVDGSLNLLKKIPDLDLNVEFTGMNLPSINNFVKAYGKFDIDKGQMHLVSEVKLLDGKFDGYVKPLFRDVVILNLEEDIGEKSAIRLLWEGILEVGKEIFENPKKDQVATVVPINGHIDQVETEVWPTIINVLRNAFVEAFTAEFESNVQNAVKG
ncbi:DUF748 domain-containing protein [soil metagenome]